MTIRRTLVPLSAVLAAAAVGAQQPVVHQFGGPTMGSSYEIKFVGDVPIAEVRAAVEAELAACDATFSAWRDDSELARVNAHASTEPFPVGPLFAKVLQQALDVAAATDGAFDPTVKPLTDLYRAGKRDPSRFTPQAADAARRLVDHRRVAVRDGSVVKTRPDVTLDLDGIAAGACADAIAARLGALGVKSFYVQVTGEVLCRGEKAPGMPWRVGVVDPAADAGGGSAPVAVLPLRDRALCTSGTYRNAVVAGDKVVHHVFDPRTGRNAAHDVVSASVLANTAAIADALGTALLVLGDADLKRRWPALQQLGALAVLMLKPGDDGKWQRVEVEWPADG